MILKIEFKISINISLKTFAKVHKTYHRSGSVDISDEVVLKLVMGSASWNVAEDTADVFSSCFFRKSWYFNKLRVKWKYKKLF